MHKLRYDARRVESKAHTRLYALKHAALLNTLKDNYVRVWSPRLFMYIKKDRGGRPKHRDGLLGDKPVTRDPD